MQPDAESTPNGLSFSATRASLTGRFTVIVLVALAPTNQALLLAFETSHSSVCFRCGRVTEYRPAEFVSVAASSPSLVPSTVSWRSATGFHTEPDLYWTVPVILSGLP